MIEFVNILNQVSTRAFDAAYWPIRDLPPFWSMTVISLLAGIFMVWIFGRISNQAAIKTMRSQIQANLLAIRLFQDDLRVFFLVQARVFKFTGQYMLHSLVPMLIMTVPIFFLLAQLNLRYAARPFNSGESGLLEMTLAKDSWPGARSIKSEVGPGLKVDAGPVRIEEKRIVSWRIRALEPGWHAIRFSIGTNLIEQGVLAGPGITAAPTLRTSSSWVDLLLYPGDALIPAASGVESIRIQYPSREIKFAGWNIDWLAHFLIASILFGFIFKGPLKVEL